MVQFQKVDEKIGLRNVPPCEQAKNGSYETRLSFRRTVPLNNTLLSLLLLTDLSFSFWL